MRKIMWLATTLLLVGGCSSNGESPAVDYRDYDVAALDREIQSARQDLQYRSELGINVESYCVTNGFSEYPDIELQVTRDRYQTGEQVVPCIQGLAAEIAAGDNQNQQMLVALAAQKILSSYQGWQRLAADPNSKHQAVYQRQVAQIAPEATLLAQLAEGAEQRQQAAIKAKGKWYLNDKQDPFEQQQIHTATLVSQGKSQQQLRLQCVVDADGQSLQLSWYHDEVLAVPGSVVRFSYLDKQQQPHTLAGRMFSNSYQAGYVDNDKRQLLPLVSQLLAGEALPYRLVTARADEVVDATLPAAAQVDELRQLLSHCGLN